jgi:AcrR family transcriptional regulator
MPKPNVAVATSRADRDHGAIAFRPLVVSRMDETFRLVNATAPAYGRDMPRFRSAAKSKRHQPEVRRRNARTHQTILVTAAKLLQEKGYVNVTVEAIAAGAGTGKQTIYRWWPSKVDILLDTLIDDASGQLAVPDTEPAADSIRRYLHSLARFVAGEPAGKVLLALIGEAQHDPDMARAFGERYLGPQRDKERAMLQRGVTSGEFPADLDTEAVLDALTGPILYRALTGRPIPPAFVDDLIIRWLPA